MAGFGKVVAMLQDLHKFDLHACWEESVKG
jgi:hypothetical protein